VGSLASLHLFLAILTITGGLGEEPAWRGFALPRLLARHNALVAGLVLAMLWAALHLPLVWTEGAPLHQQPIWLLFLGMTAKSVLLTWVFLHTRGSVLLAMLLHASTNLFVFSPVVAEAEGSALPLLAAAAKWALVAVLIAVAGPGLAKGPRPEASPKSY
jgi:membrane protease YdiL (CAAX protease family)